MKKRRSILRVAACMMSLCIFGMLFSNVAKATNTSASWYATHVHIQGAPTSASHVADVTIKHRALGATAICNSVSHTNPSAYTGTTYIYCYTYEMSQASIVNTGTTQCVPNVGAPLQDIDVRYLISAYTSFDDDTYTCSGNISKNE